MKLKVRNIVAKTRQQWANKCKWYSVIVLSRGTLLTFENPVLPCLGAAQGIITFRHFLNFTRCLWNLQLQNSSEITTSLFSMWKHCWKMDNPWKIKAGGIYKSLMKRKENDLNQTSRELCSILIFRGVPSLRLTACPWKSIGKWNVPFGMACFQGILNMFVLGSVGDGISTLQKKWEALTIVQTQNKTRRELYQTQIRNWNAFYVNPHLSPHHLGNIFYFFQPPNMEI